MTDLNITAAHINCLSRIDRGEPVGDLGNVLGELYLHGLLGVLYWDGCAQKASTLALTAKGRAVLAAHDSHVTAIVNCYREAVKAQEKVKP